MRPFLCCLLLLNAAAFAQTFGSWNGKTVGTSAGNISSIDGKTIGTAAGNYGKWNNLNAPGGTVSFALVASSPSSVGCSGSTTCSVSLVSAMSAGNLATVQCVAAGYAKIKSVSAGGTLQVVSSTEVGATGDYDSSGYIYPTTATAGPIVITGTSDFGTGTSCVIREYTVSGGAPHLDWAHASVKTGTTTATGETPVFGGTKCLVVQLAETNYQVVTAVSGYANLKTSSWPAFANLINTTSTTPPTWTISSGTGNVGTAGMAFSVDGTPCVDLAYFDASAGTNGSAATAATLASSVHGMFDSAGLWGSVATNHVTYSTSSARALTNQLGPLCGNRGTYQTPTLGLHDDISTNGLTFSWALYLSNEDPNVSIGYWFKTSLPNANTTEYIGTMPIFGMGSDFANTMTSNGRIYIETPGNPNGNPDVGSKFAYSENTWYWITVQFRRYVNSTTTHQLNIYDASGTLLSHQEKVSQSSSPQNVNRIQFVSANDNGNAPYSVDVSSIKIDTSGTFPLLP